MSGLVRVTVDGRTVEVPAGTLVTDAARAAEVHVPIFCSHQKLPPLGACRICVVEVGTPKLGPDRKPVIGPDGNPEIAWMPKVQTGCTTTVSDGMHVRTRTEVATAARKGVMEFLLVNHPLDCPVCDEGGECQLQDLAFAFGHDYSRMDEAKRTFDSEDLGPIVKKEANRCIVCMRCVRYCDEVMGENALTAHQRGVFTEISSFDRQPLACEQCGNCVEVCPVGALTALPYRFKARPWDLRQHITICEWCPNGCSVRLGVRGMEILRARGTEFRGVNQEYLCVRGRFGHDWVNAPDRLTAPLVKTGAALEPATRDVAVAWAAARLRDIAATHGPEAIAFLGGEKLNLEEMYLMQKLARGVLGTPHVDARTRQGDAVPAAALRRATGAGRPPLTFDALTDAQEVLVLFDDLQGEAPFAQAAIVRGFRQRGLHVTVAHARRVKLARPRFKGDWLAVKPGAELPLVLELTRAALALGIPDGVPAEVRSALEALKPSLGAERAEAETGVAQATIAAAARRMREAGRKALLFGRGVLEHPHASALVQAIENLAWSLGAISAERSDVMAFGAHHDSAGAIEMGLAPDLLPGGLAAGDAAARAAYEKPFGRLPQSPGLAARDILAAAAAGKVRALWIASDDLLASAPDRALVEQALERCELVIVNELFLTRTAARAHVVFPVAAFAEKDGSTLNSEGRLQRSNRALSPRPGSRPDWEVFQEVARALGADWRYRTAEDVFREIARVVPGFNGLSYATLLPNGGWLSSAPAAANVAPVAPAPAADDAAAKTTHWLLAGGTLFADGSLSQRSDTLAKLAGSPRARLSPAEASRLGLAAGDRVELTGPAGAITLPLELDDSVPAGAVFVPYAGAELNRLGAATGAGLRVGLRRAGQPAQPGAAAAVER